MKTPSLRALLALALATTAVAFTACGEKKTEVEKTTVIEKQVEVPVPAPAPERSEGGYGERIGDKIDRRVDQKIEEAIDSF